MQKKTKIIVLTLMAVILLVGIVLMVYPLISSMYAQNHHSEAFGAFIEEVEKQDTTKIDSEWREAQSYNEMLFDGAINRLDPVNNGYYEQLDLHPNDIMAYITIPKIDVMLPIFHGTSSEVLKVGAGHMPESSLPIGGTNTHSVITAHSGMASEPMFTDLEMLEIGDMFQIIVLDEVLTYEVYSIPEPILPQQVDAIQIQSGEDLCTLITCTPYGVNTHRLLIHAKRIPTPMVNNTDSKNEPDTSKKAVSVWAENYKKSLLTGIIIAIVAIFVLVVIVILYVYLSRKGKKSNDK